MPISIDAFKRVADSAIITSRDIDIRGEGANATARLGNYIFSAGKKANAAVMNAFREAIQKEYGVFGTHAFDTVLGARQMMGKSLRACDVKETLSRLDSVKKTRFTGELNRQLDTNPKFRTLSPELRQKIRNKIADNPYKGVDPTACKTQSELARMAVKRLDAAISENSTGDAKENIALGARKKLEQSAGEREATGLRNLKAVFDVKDTSIEDKIKKGAIGTGMRVNRSNTNPVLLDKLKTNGVEPGFIFRNDWSKDDTHGFMADINSPESLKALEDLKAKDAAFRERCGHRNLREQIMLAGRAHPAGMAAVAEFVIERAVAYALSGVKRPNFPFQELADALKNQLSEPDLKRLNGAVSDPKNKALLKEVKLYLFTEVRDAVMSVDFKNDYYKMSPIFKHFSDRAIVKLDYNEADKLGGAETASAGKFRRPERILATRGAITGPIYRFTSRQSADKISAGAVTEALANDLTRLAGVPSQELEIVRGKYSDGHPKIMLSAKFAVGYKDMEAKMLKDGRAVPPPPDKHGKPGPEPEPLGKYKAFFLLTADRDGVGKRGQNKGFINGKFFAIDPGHSLEGNGKYLDISDDFSFKDTFGKSSKPRFNNFSVFDDDTRFAKLSGLIELRNVAKSGAFEKLFSDYKTAFDPNEPGISKEEIALRTRICAEIDEKKAEFDTQFSRLMNIFGMQLELNDQLAADGPKMQEGAVNTLSHLEMLTSPTTWVSKHGEVALKHLEVRPETRVPWRAGVDDSGNIVYHCDKPLSAETRAMLANLAQISGATLETDAAGVTRLTVTKDAAERVFAAFSEENVQKLTHPEEYAARKNGEDALKIAKDFKPVAATQTVDPRPPLTAAQLPEVLDIEMNGVTVQYPKIHYETMLYGTAPEEAPRTVEELKSFLEARARRGYEILNALRNGNTNRFEPSRDNMIAITHALHHVALQKGQYMYRGAFSIADPDGSIAKWLDGSKDIYARASTHAHPYHSMTVDGHRNEARGFDTKSQGMDGMLNGMRTFHYFTIPDTDHLNDKDGGSGPRRRLYLKCETFGVFVNKISSENAKASFTPDMKKRGYIFGDLFESIAHGTSLFVSYFTPKEMPGIHKENLLERQKKIIDETERKLVGAGLHDVAERLVSGDVRDGAGIRKLIDNLAEIYENHMPTDPAQRLRAAELLDELLNDLAETTQHLAGPDSQRLGNEIMID